MDSCLSSRGIGQHHGDEKRANPLWPGRFKHVVLFEQGGDAGNTAANDDPHPLAVYAIFQ
jgi:hypothetical protein